MEEAIKAMAQWGPAGVLAGGNLWFLFLLTTKVLPRQSAAFRRDVRLARVQYAKILKRRDLRFEECLKTIVTNVEQILAKNADEIAALRGIVEAALGERVHRQP